MAHHLLARRLRSHGKKVFAGLVAATLLLPVPAFATGFLGNWSVFDNHGGYAPAPKASSEFTNTGGSLTVDLGKYPSLGFSSVVATDYFWVNSPGELVNITSGFQDKLFNSTMKFDIFVTPVTPGGTPFQTPIAYGPASSVPYTFVNNYSATPYLAGGEYKVSVFISSKDWNRFAGTKDVSPFSITITGL